MSTLRIGIAGLGTVGCGVVKILHDKAEIFADHTGSEIALTAVSARDKKRERGIDVSNATWFDNAEDVAKADVDVVVELIGGADGVAYALCKSALQAGKHVVTANKALIAKHGVELAKIAEEKNVALVFEAAVAGGIPIIKTLKEGLVANHISRISGILNGTCNYILTTMEKDGREFDAVLAEAQALGYAEADPSFDIDGVDTAHKLSILASLAFGAPVNLADIHIEGIRSLSRVDINFAAELGYAIKLLGIAERNDKGEIAQHVYPCMVKLHSPLARVDGVLNAVVVECDQLGPLLLEGAGAGAGPTASSVVADIMDIASGSVGGRKTYPFARPVAKLKQAPYRSMLHHEGAYYIRLSVLDKPGVLAAIATIFKEQNISVESLLQRAREPEKPVQIVLTTHITQEQSMVNALTGLAKLEHVLEQPCIIRIEGE